ncbi:hypothetical protein ACTMSW_26520 [Micromonospora sp. BQ11]|uniref:hypothetical protein n=1 Tax=Micromonospora sp. BQ11 TaxID=3452212 RepID=UPI003F8A5430
MAEQQAAPGAEDATGRLRRQVAAFFSPDRWQTPLPQFEHSGYALVEQVRSWQPRFVVDVGCGPHLSKGKIENLIRAGRDEPRPVWQHRPAAIPVPATVVVRS